MALTQVQQELNGLAKQVNIILDCIEHQSDESTAIELRGEVEAIKDKMKTIIYNYPLDAEQLANQA